MLCLLLAGGTGGAAAQECAVALSGGGAFPVAYNVDRRLPRAGFVGLDFGCEIGKLRVGMILDQHGKSQHAALFFNDLSATDGLLGRVGREFAIGEATRAPWLEAAVMAGPTWTEEVSVPALDPPPPSRYANPGFAAGAAVRFGLRLVRAVSLFLESGVRYNRVGVRPTGVNIPVDKFEWMMTIPLGVGVRWSF